MAYLLSHINQIIGIAKTCTTMDELKHKVALFYGKNDLQITIDDDIK